MRTTEHVDGPMFREGHRRLYRAMFAIERGDVVDPLTLSDELERRGNSNTPVDASISRFSELRAAVANVEYHARIVKEKALLRADQ